VWPWGFEPGGKATPEEIRKGLQLEPNDDKNPLWDWMAPSVDLWLGINQRFHAFGDDALLGHSYLCALRDDLKLAKGDTDDAAKAAVVLFHWNHHIFPQVVDIIQSNDLQAKVLPKGDSGDLKDLCGEPKPTEPATTPLLAWSSRPKELEGEWTSRGSGMLRTITLRLTAATARKPASTQSESGA
jgi:hypothetical protein